MGIYQRIKAAKQNFREHQHGKHKEKLMHQNAQLEKEKLRQEEIMKESMKKQRMEKDINRMKEVNTRGSNIRKLGTGLAKFVNKSREVLKEAKESGHFKGIDFGTNQSPFNIKQKK